jgi:hypothetical protein
MILSSLVSGECFGLLEMNVIATSSDLYASVARTWQVAKQIGDAQAWQSLNSELTNELTPFGVFSEHQRVFRRFSQRFESPAAIFSANLCTAQHLYPLIGYTFDLSAFQ